MVGLRLWLFWNKNITSITCAMPVIQQLHRDVLSKTGSLTWYSLSVCLHFRYVGFSLVLFLIVLAQEKHAVFHGRWKLREMALRWAIIYTKNIVLLSEWIAILILWPLLILMANDCKAYTTQNLIISLFIDTFYIFSALYMYRLQYLDRLLWSTTLIHCHISVSDDINSKYLKY